MTTEPVIDIDAVPDEDAPNAPEPTPTAALTTLPMAHGLTSTAIIPAGSPEEVLKYAERVANLLSNVIVQQGMRTLTGRQKVPVMNPDGSVKRNERNYPVEEWRDRWHVQVEGWQTLASFLGLAVRTTRCEPMRGDDGLPRITEYHVHEKRTKGKGDNAEIVERDYTIRGYDWEATVIAVKDGVVVGEAKAMCTRSESSWAERDDFALSSMAQTRATSRAIAAAARWIVTLAGFSGAPAEEMTPERGENPATTTTTTTTGSASGSPASEKQQETLLKVLQFMLDRPGADPATEATALFNKIGTQYEQIPATVAWSLGQVAIRLRELDQAAMDEHPPTPPAAEPASTADIKDPPPSAESDIPPVEVVSPTIDALIKRRLAGENVTLPPESIPPDHEKAGELCICDPDLTAADGTLLRDDNCPIEGHGSIPF